MCRSAMKSRATWYAWWRATRLNPKRPRKYPRYVNMALGPRGAFIVMAAKQRALAAVATM